MSENEASKRAELKIISVLICDDVRREENGKEILIGVYSGDIIVTRFPAAMALTI
jgi:hypothetical protein